MFNIYFRIDKWKKKKNVTKLMEALEDRSISVKIAAASAIGEISKAEPQKKAIKVLKSIANSGNSEAMEELFIIYEKKGFDSLARLATAEDVIRDIRFKAMIMLRNNGEKGINSLLELLGEYEYTTRYNAKEALSILGDKTWLNTKYDGLISKFDNSYDKDIYTYAVSPEIDSRKVIPLFRAIGTYSFRSKLSFNTFDTVVKTLTRLGDSRVIEPLLSVAEHPYNEDYLETAVYGLGFFYDENAIVLLKNALIHPNYYVRSAAAVSLGKFGYSKVKLNLPADLLEILGTSEEIDILDMLFDMLSNKLLYDRYRSYNYELNEALNAIEKLHDKRAIIPLIAAIKRKKMNKEKIAFILGELGDLRAFDTLVKALSNKNPIPLRISAAEALGKLGDPRATEHLINTLNATNDELLKTTINSLSKIGDNKAKEPLKKLLSKKDEAIVLLAKEAIKNL